MNSKSELLYKRALLSFKSSIIGNNSIPPNNIIFKRAHIDMEIALANAIKSTFDNCEIKFCYFHYAKSFNRRINNVAY